jgi:hypothetical protein
VARSLFSNIVYLGRSPAIEGKECGGLIESALADGLHAARSLPTATP